MKKFIEYLSKNNIISIIVTGIFCSVIYILRENIEFRKVTINYINLAASCLLLWMVYNAARKIYTRWRYIVCLLLAIFVFNRFYDEEVFLHVFHFDLINFVTAIGVIGLLIIFYPFIKRFFVWSAMKISALFEKWVERREIEEEEHKKRIKERSVKNKKKNNTKIKEKESEVSGVTFYNIDEEPPDKKEPSEIKINESKSPNGIAGIISVMLFIAVLAVLSGILFWSSSSQIANIMEKATSSNWMNVILSLAVIILLMVFEAGIIVSLLIKWGQIIIGIAQNQQKREMYFVFACGLFLISQHIFTNYSFTTDDLANLLLDGKLFTFPLVLSILIPVFIIFAENIIDFATNNKKIKKALKKCGKQTIRIAKGIIQSLLDFVELVTKDFLSMVLEIAKEDELEDEDD